MTGIPAPAGAGWAARRAAGWARRWTLRGMQRWGAFVACTQVREDAASLALCRIATGLVVLGQCGNLLREGAYATIYAHGTHGGLGTMHGVLRMFGGASAQHVALWIGAWAASAVLVVVGLWTRAALLACAYFFHTLVALNPHAGAGYDRVLHLLLLLLFLGGAGRALSFDARHARAARPTWRIFRRLALLHLTLIYFGSGLAKLSAGWVPFGDHSALWWILHNPIWARAGGSPLEAQWLPVTQALTLLSWFWEVGAPLWWGLFAWAGESNAAAGRPPSGGMRGFARQLGRRLAGCVPVAGIGFHLGIECLLEVGSFGYLTLCLYPLIVPPQAWRALFTRLATRSSPRAR